MKRIYLYTVSACLLLLSACSSENNELPGVGNTTTPSAALRIEVSASDFTHAGDANTRATDSGNTTTFEHNDRIGITVLDASGKILYDNIPYKYNKSGDDEGTWVFDKDNGEGKTALYYDNKATTYLAYFPYSSKADGAEDEGKLKELFPPLPDQRSKYAYRASDLLLGEGKPSDDSPKKLEIAFTHAYSSLSFPSSVEATCTIADEEKLSYSASVSDVSFTIDGELLLAYRASDGSYRIVISPKSDETNVRYLFEYYNKMYSGTSSGNLAVNTLYALRPNPLDIGKYGLDNARLGDFYCKKSESEGYLIPNEVESLSEKHKAACLGIVCWVGDVTDDNYGKLPDNFDVHGLVVALEDLEYNNGNNMYWGPNSSVQSWLTADNNKMLNELSLLNDFNIRTEDKKQGYVNTLVLKKYAVNNKTVYPIEALNAFNEEASKYKAPSNSSGWYWPSVYELRYVCSGTWKTDTSVDGISLKETLEKQFKKVGGTFNFAVGNGNLYWSSTESSIDSGSRAWFVSFGIGRVFDDGIKNSITYRVRPLLCF